MKKGKKILSYALIISLMTMSETSVLANEPVNNVSSEIKMTDEVAIEMATNFLEGMEPEKNIYAENPVKFYDINGKARGYIVHYYQDEVPYGYIVIDTTFDVPISEFSIGENAMSPYEKVIEQQQSSCFDASDDEWMICTGPYTYAILNENGNSIDMYGEENIYEEEAFFSSKPDWGDCFITVQEMYENYTPVESDFISKSVTLSEGEAIAYSGRFACAVSALYVCAMYYNVVSKSDLSTEYNKMWDYTNTNFKTDSNVYGETATKDMGPGFVNFCKSKGVSVSYSNKLLNVYSELKKNVKNNQISVVCGTIGEVAHAMAVEGYTVVKAKNTGKTLNTLVVADGWYNTLTYLNYDYPELMYETAVCFSK